MVRTTWSEHPFKCTRSALYPCLRLSALQLAKRVGCSYYAVSVFDRYLTEMAAREGRRMSDGHHAELNRKAKNSKGIWECDASLTYAA